MEKLNRNLFQPNKHRDVDWLLGRLNQHYDNVDELNKYLYNEIQQLKNEIQQLKNEIITLKNK